MTSLIRKLMKQIQKIKNKWQIVLHLEKLYEYMPPRIIFRFGVFNIQSLPEMGEMLYKKHYKGFIFKYRFRHPFAIVKDYLEKKGY